MASETIGKIGTRLSRFPLPVISKISTPSIGASALNKFNASEIRRPAPYNRSSTATSLSLIHWGTSLTKSVASKLSRAFSTGSGLGMECASFGEEINCSSELEKL